MRSLGLWIVTLCLICGYVWSDESASAVVFFRIDTNFDGFLSPEEFNSAMSSDDDVADKSELASVFAMLDKDADGLLSKEEFHEIELLKARQEVWEMSDTFEVHTRDGKVKTMSRDELHTRTMDNPDGVRTNRHNQMYKYDEETLDMAKLSEEKPLLDRLIRIGNWTLHSLKSVENGLDQELELRGLKSLPLPEVNPEGVEEFDIEDMTEEHMMANRIDFKFSSEFRLHLKLRLSTPGNDEVIDFVHVLVEYNRYKYAAPHLQILQAIRGKDKVAVPFPTTPKAVLEKVLYIGTLRVPVRYIQWGCCIALLVLIGSIIHLVFFEELPTDPAAYVKPPAHLLPPKADSEKSDETEKKEKLEETEEPKKLK